MNFDHLSPFGWDTYFSDLWKNHEPALADPILVPSRILSENRGHYLVAAGEGVTEARLTGRLRFEAENARHTGDRKWPAVGDWVALRPGEPALIDSVLARRSLLTRKAAGESSEEQVLAANVDVAFLVTSMNEDLNPRRIERYLALAWNAGVEPIVVLTKGDLRSEEERATDRALLAEIELAAPIFEASGVTGEGVEALRERLASGKTGVLIGSSGVGKSTLTNALLGVKRQEVKEILGYGAKGQHTTTVRHLFEVPGGGCLIDTPGMRELGLAHDREDGLSHGFPEIEALVTACRFSNCAHETEPGCAVRSALESGEVSAERFASYLKLRREAAYQERKGDKAKASAARAQWKRISVEARQHVRRKRWEN